MGKKLFSIENNKFFFLHWNKGKNALKESTKLPNSVKEPKIPLLLLSTGHKSYC